MVREYCVHEFHVVTVYTIMLSFVILFHGTLPPALGISHLFHSTLCCGHAGMYVFPSLGLNLNSQEENKI